MQQELIGSQTNLVFIEPNKIAEKTRIGNVTSVKKSRRRGRHFPRHELFYDKYFDVLVEVSSVPSSTSTSRVANTQLETRSKT